MDSKADKQEMEKYLKDANVYEENMSDDLIEGYYKAIKNSHTSLKEFEDSRLLIDEGEKSLNDSANELLEAINNSESIAPSKNRTEISLSDDDSLEAFSQDMLPKVETKSVESEPNNNNNSDLLGGKTEKQHLSDLIADVAKIPIGFNDMQKSGISTLNIITHELKFVNVQNSKKFIGSNSDVRIKLLYDYHNAANRCKAFYASLSSNIAPLGKPITAIDYDFCPNPVVSSLKEEENQMSHEVAYVSRSGRLTKRKVYREFDDNSLDSFSLPKKSKNDEEWLSKTSPKGKNKRNEMEKTNSNNNSALEKLVGKPLTKIKTENSPDSSQDYEQCLSDIDIDDFEDATTPKVFHPIPRTYQRKTPSNDEIMSRCPTLFKDNFKKGRAAECLSAALETAEKKKQEEKELEEFTKSLEVDSQELEEDIEKFVIEDDVEFRRRIVPPLPTSRKGIHGRKRGSLEPLNITAKKPNVTTNLEDPKTPIVNGLHKRTPRGRGANNRRNIAEPSSSSTSKGKKDVVMTACPLCSLSFPQKDIEEHAATCGEDMFPQTPQPKRITCEICDSVVPFDTEYEVHVKACLIKNS